MKTNTAADMSIEKAPSVLNRFTKAELFRACDLLLASERDPEIRAGLRAVVARQPLAYFSRVRQRTMIALAIFLS